MKDDHAELAVRLKELQKEPHCANCGRIAPEVFGYGGEHESGLTVCCQDNVCVNNEEFTFGDHQHSVRACCWAAAELRFRMKGVDVVKLKGIQRSR